MKFIRTVTECIFTALITQLTIAILWKDSGRSSSINGNSSFLAKLKHVPNICQNIQDIYTSGNQFSRFLYLSLAPLFPFCLSFFFRRNKDMENCESLEFHVPNLCFIFHFDDVFYPLSAPPFHLSVQSWAECHYSFSTFHYFISEMLLLLLSNFISTML